MKKVFTLVLLAGSLLSAPVFAQHHGHGGGGYYRSGGNWVAPLIGGVIIGGILTQPRYAYPAPPVIYQQTPPVIIQQQPQVIYQQPQVQVQQYCEYFAVTDQFGVQRSVPYCYTK